MDNLDNKETISVVAGNEEKKEFKIKRGIEIQSGKDGLIYALTFLNDVLNFYSPYLQHWSGWLEVEDSYIKEEFLRDLFSVGEDESIDMAINMHFEKGLCQTTISKIIDKVNNTINLVKNGFDIKVVKCAIEEIENSVKKLEALISYSFFSQLVYDTFYMESMCFYDGVVTAPLYCSFDMISSIIKQLSEMSEEWFYAKSEECYCGEIL